MIDFDYLYKGICGLARAHRAGTMAGHLGAAVVAGYFYGEEHADLEDEVTSAIEEDLDGIIGGEESVWYSARKTGIAVAELFEPFPKTEANEQLVGSIVQELGNNISKTRQSGHNVIFAAIAVRALHDHPEFATPEIVAGIRKLIAGFNGVVPGRGYYGKERGWLNGNQVVLEQDSGFPVYKSESEMAQVVIDDLIRWGATRKQGFGGHFHIINHATALTELSKYGYEDVARRGLPAHHHHVRLWRSLPDVEGELGKLKQANHHPKTREYWASNRDSQWSAHLTHRIKTLYGFSKLTRFIENDETRALADQKFLYLMA